MNQLMKVLDGIAYKELNILSRISCGCTEFSDEAILHLTFNQRILSLNEYF